MISFSDLQKLIKSLTPTHSLLEQKINKHSTHIEEMIFTNGEQGLNDAIDGLKYVIDTIGKGKPGVSTKIDGCVDANTLVVTTKGPKQICQLTNQDYVKCFDINTQKFTYCNNTMPRITGKNKRWVSLTFANGASLQCTDDHPILNHKLSYSYASRMHNTYAYCITTSTKRLEVIDVDFLEDKQDQWDLTTITENFVVKLGDHEIVLHNSPAIFMINTDKGFAVASKSIFNKSPKINYTEQDIDKNHSSGGLNHTLKVALQYLKKVAPKNKNKIYQGDMLFTKDSIRHLTHNGKQLLGFHPNTIFYTVEQDSDIGKRIANSELGIAVHTEYDWDGEDFSTMNVSQFGISKDLFKENSKVFLIDTISNLVAKHDMEFTEQQSKEITNALSIASKLGKEIDWNIVTEPIAQSLLTSFINSYIRDNKQFPSNNDMVKQLHQWIDDKKEKDKAKLKTEKGKSNTEAKYQQYQQMFDDTNSLLGYFEIFKQLMKVKLSIINKLNTISLYNNFVLKTNGDLVNTGDEGFVISSTNAKGAKLVDRYEFSKNNFSKDIVKGFEH